MDLLYGRIRNGHLGYDRHGNRHWFVCGRYVIEDVESPRQAPGIAGSYYYYSTQNQVRELLDVLDDDLEGHIKSYLETNKELIIEIMSKNIERSRSVRLRVKSMKPAYLEVIDG